MRAAWFVIFGVFSALAFAQGGKQSGPQGCTLLTKADVERVTGKKQYTEPTPTAASGCGYDNAQLYIYTGRDSEAAWETTLARFKYEPSPRTPISGLGDKAYSFYPPPRSKYEDTNAVVVVVRGNYTVVMSVAAPEGKPASSVQPQALDLVKLVLAKLR